MIKYQTWMNKITKTEVDKETEKSVFFKDPHNATGFRSERKQSYGIGYFDTWKEAKTFLEITTQNKIYKLENKIDYQKIILKEIQNLKKEG